MSMLFKWIRPGGGGAAGEEGVQLEEQWCEPSQSINFFHHYLLWYNINKGQIRNIYITQPVYKISESFFSRLTEQKSRLSCQYFDCKKMQNSSMHNKQWRQTEEVSYERVVNDFFRAAIYIRRTSSIHANRVAVKLRPSCE